MLKTRPPKVAGGSNNHNYANVDLIVDVAERTHVDAVWAGWGHASENPEVIIISTITYILIFFKYFSFLVD
jgi:biotin carboxylase